MIQTGFEHRVKIQQVIDSQLPEFILDESPKTSEFLKQYYISQEYQGGNVDIAENLDQYLKLDNLTPEVVVGSTSLSDSISSSSNIITVTSTKGFPSKYGLLKINDEIITYTGLTTNTFTGCIRGFSGITSYHQDIKSEELTFSTSRASSHNQSTEVQNLSVLFLQEFYKKIKFNLTPGLENKNFVPNLNVGNFIKEAKTLYQAKGTNESFRILFNVLFGETPKVIDLENYLLKPSSANYLRRNVILAESISGNITSLEGQTIFKNNDPKTTASISEVEIIQRKGKTYYKLFVFIGYDDSYPILTGSFNITGSTKNINSVSVGSSIITVDSTIGFPYSGKIYAGNNVITYTDKSINQFFGCSGVTSEIPIASTIRSDDIYYGYENGDTSKKVEFRITGVLSGYKSIFENSVSKVGEKIKVKNVGELIQNNNLSRKEIFANSWIYNTSSRYYIDSFNSGQISQFTLKSDIDKSSLKVGDYIDILSRNSNSVVVSNLLVTQINQKQVTTNNTFVLNPSFNYDIRRKIKTATSTFTTLEYNSLFSDVQNTYNENDEFMYVASNSLPSYTISKKIFSYNASGVLNQNINTGLYSVITFSTKVSFITGSEIYYKPSQSPISGLSEGLYYVEVLPGNLQIKLYASRSVVSSNNYLNFGALTTGTHNFTLSSQKEKVLSAQKILRKFPLTSKIQEGGTDLTEPGSIGMLSNGVEIFSYKSDNKIYYGPLEKINVLNGGKDFDVINPPSLLVSNGNALLQPVISGSVEKIYVTPQNFDIDVVVSVSLTGGNGKGCSFEPIIERKRREIEFDAREIGSGGGIDVDFETITFSSKHGLINGEAIIYRPGNNPSLGIGSFQGNNFNTGQTLKSESTYYTKYISDTTIQLYPSYNDYVSGINTVGFTTIGTAGIQKFATEPKKTLTEIKVLNGGSGYTNRKLRVSPSGISTANYTINYNNHGFNTGELITYQYETSGISGLSTSNQYYVLKLDDNTFRLVNAGIGGTYTSDYERVKYVKLQSTGTGYQIFNYPQISLSVEYTSSGIGSTQFRGNIEAYPVVKGEIVDVYTYESGVGYGSSILNQHTKPSILIKNGKNAQIKPVVYNGRIQSVSIQYGGDEYYSLPNLKVIGKGSGASLRAVVVNNKIVDVIIVNPGAGYSTFDTSIIIDPSGKNAVFDPVVRSLTVNNNILFNDVNDSTFSSNEIIVSRYENLQYAISGYSGLVQNIFGESNESHSPIIGWAYDGNPIYGSYGYSDPKNKNSLIKKLVSGYSLNSTSIIDRPLTFDTGFFIEDYQFTNSGDLDEYNGRFCVTPEFPNGIYAYFAISEIDLNGNLVGSFPYFIGNKYKSKFIQENKTLNQDFDFNSSKLIRNTFPYKVADKYADNDFISESNEIVNQITNIDSVTSGFIENFDIINSGDNYKVRDQLKFDETNTGGGGLIAEISEIKGKNILNIETKVDTYNNSVFTWNSGETIKVSIPSSHNLQNLNYVSLSGFSTQLSELNGLYQVGITSYKSTLTENLQNYATTGIVTDISLTSIPENISVGSSLKIDNEIFKVLNIFNYQNIIRISRSTSGTSHTSTSPVYFIPDYFIIKKSTKYFDSSLDNLVYFNAKESIGVGTTSGAEISKTYRIGTKNRNISIPTQSIFVPNHPFQNGQEVTFTKPSSTSSFSVSNTSGGAIFAFPESGDSQKVYVIKKSSDYIGIVTQIGLTTSSGGLFFTSDGNDDYRYSIQSNFRQITGNVEKIYSTITLDTQHNLLNGDKISLNVAPNLSVGIGTSTSVYLKYNSQREILIANPIGFSSSSINTNTSEITIYNHGFKTGDKVFYQSSSPAIGLSTGFYFIYRVNSNSIKLCETLNDSISNSPLTVNITGVTTAISEIGLVNPELLPVKNNNLVFNLKDSSLVGYNLRIFYDNEFKNEFVSTGSTTIFSVSRTGTPGVSTNASLIINYSGKIPNCYYTLEKSGLTLNPDKEVKNYSRISYIESLYNGSYKILGIGSTTFDISLSKAPENNLYRESDCYSLEYSTNSTNDYGGVNKIRIISSGNGFKDLPTFKFIETELGSGSYVVPKSSNIGKINQVTIVNEGFEYSSDKTLNPEALIPSSLLIKNANTISSFNISDGGKNYISAPDLIVVDSETGIKITSGLLFANLSGTSIGSITIDQEPKGLPDFPVKIMAINNSNGIGIQNVQSSSSGIVTCTIITPLSGFGVEPFAIGDKIFVEGISKSGTSGDGFNSENYGYQFFTVTDYLNAGTSVSRQVKFRLPSNPGVASTIQSFTPKIVNYKNYPKITANQKFSEFILGELLDIDNGNGFVSTDLILIESSKSYIKVSGSYNLTSNQVVRGKQSGSLATIEEVKLSKGIFDIQYALIDKIGWSDDIGKLNDNYQVIPDNDYYQNLSYTIKSNQEWSDIVSPVNSILHTSGLKNFADTSLINNVAGFSTFTTEYTSVIYDILEEKRVDAINNFDLVIDDTAQDNLSTILKFKNKKLTDYIECRTNRVLELDDISSQFSNSDIELQQSTKVTTISPSKKYEKYLIQVSNSDYSQIQFTELVILVDNNDIFTLEKASLSNTEDIISKIYGYSDNILNQKYLTLEPTDPNNFTYNVKYLNSSYSNFNVGVGTSSLGLIDLTAKTSTVSSSQTSNIIQYPSSTTKSLFSEIHIVDNNTNQMNYVEIFVDHDGTNTNLSEFYFDNSDDTFSSNFIGSFTSSISSGILNLSYTNTSNNPITIRTKTVGFGSTSVGIATYRYTSVGQPYGSEKTVRFESSYSNISTASTVFLYDYTLFSAVKSTIRVSTGQTTSLHQVMTINDQNDTYILQYPFLSIGSTSGIGTFGSEIGAGGLASLKFYPDQSGTFEVISFNEMFYREYDFVNLPQNLEYGNAIQSVGTTKYFGRNTKDINKLSFDLSYQGIPVFMKTFDPSNSSVLNPSTGEFNIPNHFFSTGEELIYRPNSTFSGITGTSVGIGTTLNNVGVMTNILPTTVYAIKIDNNKFKLSTRKEYALSTPAIAVTFTSYGFGNAHELEMYKKNEKTIICIDNVVQSPLSYSLINYTVNNGTQVGSASSIFGISGISSISIGDLLKIDDEYMKVNNIGFGTTYSGPISASGQIPLVNVERGFVGSSATSHSNSSTIFVYRGSFNITKNSINFTNALRGGIQDQLFGDIDNLPDSRSYFNGRVFLKNSYDDNKIFDDISKSFTGIGQTYRLSVSGVNTIGVGTTGANTIVFLNGIFQTPSTENNINNNFNIVEDNSVGITSIVFTGITSSNGSVIISESDVNLNQLPRGGLIVSLGSTNGLGYAPLLGASVVPQISAGSIISIGIGTTGNWGSGYRNPVSVAVTQSGHTGNIASITASVGAGGTLSFTIVNGGTGYTNPSIYVSSPSYENLPVIGVSRLGIGTTTETGVGLLLNVEVGAVSTTGIGSTLFEVTGFKITKNGYGFKKGDIIKPVGLVTGYDLQNPISEFNLEILDTFTDSFSAWQFGELDYIDSVKLYQDGKRNRFPLYYKSSLLSFEKNTSDLDSQLIDFDSLLIIFINGVLQQPKVAYQFNGGTSFTLTEAPKPEDNISVFFYRGSSSDSKTIDIQELIKIGDNVQVVSNNNYLGITTTQNIRTVNSILSSDRVETELYYSQGIDSKNLKPLDWIKQKVDAVINGNVVSKSRESLEPRIYPTSKIIRNLTSSDNQIFVDNAEFFNYENSSPIKFGCLIIPGQENPVSAAITAVVSASGTIQSLVINNVGSGYTGSFIQVKISSPRKIGVGIGTTATATIAVLNGSLTSPVTITNPGFGYTTTNPPQVITPLPKVIYENISDITNVQGFSGNITGIASTVGIGTDLAIKFTLDSSLSPFTNLSVGYPIYIFNTKVGNGVTAIINNNQSVVGVGTSFLDNIYYISAFDSSVGIITCNIHSGSQLNGISTSGNLVGKFSWGRLSGFTRSSSPISIAISTYTVNSGLSTYPTIQRRGYGWNNSGAIKNVL